MNCHAHYYLLLIFALFSARFSACYAQTFIVTGKLETSEGKPLAFASIVNDSLTQGTFSDEDGNFSLRLSKGTHILSIQFIGYKEKKDTLTLASDLYNKYVLEEEEFSTETIYITSDGKDPAYAIIEKAIRRKSENAHPFQEYQHKCYTKTVIGFPRSFKYDSIFGMPDTVIVKKNRKGDTISVRQENPLPPELQSPILYLSETLSQVFRKGKEKAREIIVASRVSGDSKSYSMMGGLVNQFDPYQNRMVMEQVADRGIVMPLSDNAFMYYDYKLLGTKKEAGVKVYKIGITPKRDHDPVCKGFIYIVDSSYAIKEMDVVMSKQQQIQIMDTLRLRQQYFQIQGRWIPYTTRMSFDFIFSFLSVKIPLTGASASLLSDYNTQPVFSRKMFKNEIITVQDTAVQKSNPFWEMARPLPLTPEEIRDYEFKDSVERVKNTPRYRDSTTRASNSSLGMTNLLLVGKTLKYPKFDIVLPGLLDWIAYNPIEGGVGQIHPTWVRNLDKGKKISIEPFLRYGTASKYLGYALASRWEFHPKQSELLKVEGGDYVQQMSNTKMIDPLWETYLALFDKESYIKLYRRRWIEVAYGREWFNGFFGTITYSYQQRLGMQKNTEFSFAKKKTQPFSENYIPLNPFSEKPTLPQHSASIASIKLRYRPGVKYIGVPYGKIVAEAKYPECTFTLTHAFPTHIGSADYTQAILSIQDKMAIGLLGNMQYRISAGKFFARKQTYFPDIFHYQANEGTSLLIGSFDVFTLMPYYRYSSIRPFIEGHVQHDFHGFVFNKIPLIRKLRLSEYVGLHGLWQENQKPYLTLNIGLTRNILKIIPLRIEFHYLLLGDNVQKWKFAYGMEVPGMLGTP